MLNFKHTHRKRKKERTKERTKGQKKEREGGREEGRERERKKEREKGNMVQERKKSNWQKLLLNIHRCYPQYTASFKTAHLDQGGRVRGC